MTVSVQLFAMASSHSSLSLPSMLHLYNFLLHVDSIVPGVESIQKIPLLELLCEAFGKHVFQGSRPTKNFSTRFAISSRKEISAFASDAHRRSRAITPSRTQLERLTLPAVVSTLHAVVADYYKLHGQAYSWIEKAVQPPSPTASEPQRVGRGGKNCYLQSLSPAQLLDKICQALWVDFNGSIPIGRVDMLKIRELCYTLRSKVYAHVRGDFVSRLGQRYPDQFKEEGDVDLTASILDIEKYARHTEVQKGIINATKEVFVQVFEGVKMEKYFTKMPYAKVKAWEEMDRERKKGKKGNKEKEEEG